MVKAAVVGDSGFGRDGEEGGRILRHEVAMVGRERRAARDLPSVRHVDDGAGRKACRDRTRAGDHLKPRCAGENVGLLEHGFGHQIDVLRAGGGFRTGNGGSPLSLGVSEGIGVCLADGFVDFFLRLRLKFSGQKAQRDERVARVAAGGRGIAGKQHGQQDEGE